MSYAILAVINLKWYLKLHWYWRILTYTNNINGNITGAEFKTSVMVPMKWRSCYCLRPSICHSLLSCLGFLLVNVRQFFGPHLDLLLFSVREVLSTAVLPPYCLCCVCLRVWCYFACIMDAAILLIPCFLHVVEVSRRLRQIRKRRQSWVWGSIAAAITLGTGALAWTYLSTGGQSSSTSKSVAPQQDFAAEWRALDSRQLNGGIVGEQ